MFFFSFRRAPVALACENKQSYGHHRAYAYTFVALGELPAAIVGWCMTLEYGISSAAVAKSWGEMVRTVG